MTIVKDNRANKTFSSRLTRWVYRLLPFQFKVVHAPGRTMGMADYLSRHPSDNNSNINKIKAEELWNNWFTLNAITQNELVSANQKSQIRSNHPMREKLEGANKLSESENMTDTEDAAKSNKQTLKQIAAIIKQKLPVRARTKARIARK